MIVAPAGMNCPLYISSSISRIGVPETNLARPIRNVTLQEDAPRGVGGLHRRTSFTMAEMYGN